MKHFTEAGLQSLQDTSSDTKTIAKQQGKNSLTPSGGCETKAMLMNTAIARPEAEEVKDILWRLRTIKPLQILPDEVKDAQNALRALELNKYRATREEAVYWFTRLLAHFPRRDAAQDAVVISDLSSDVVDYEISLIGMVDACDSIRRGASKKNPFMPPSGEILKRCVDKTKSFNTQLKRVRKIVEGEISDGGTVKPKRKMERAPWVGKTLDELTNSEKAELERFLSNTPEGVARVYCDSMKFTYEDFLKSFKGYKKEKD